MARLPPRRWAPPDVNASSTRTVGASIADRVSESDQRTCRRDSLKKRRAHGTVLRDSEDVVGRLGLIGALEQVVTADAQVAQRRCRIADRRTSSGAPS